MKRFLTALLTCSMVLSLGQASFVAAPETATIVQKSRFSNFTIGDTASQTETSTDIYAMNTSIDGNDVSMYPVLAIGTAGTYAKSYLPEGMLSADVVKLISFAKDKGFAKINSAVGATGEQALTDADDLDIAITAAIWGKYRYNMGSSTKYIDFDRNASNKYVKAAKYIINNYSSYTVPTTTFDVNTANIKKIAHTDGSYKYYGPFTFTSNNSSIACAETSAGVQIVDSKYSAVDKNSLAAGTNYYVAVPAAATTTSHTVKLSLQYVDKDLVVYGNTTAKFVGVVNTPFKLNETFTIGSYATAKIYDTAGTVVNVRSDDGVYDKNIVIGTNGVGYAENLTIGNYTAKQVSTADGMVLNTTPKTFVVTSASDSITIRFDSVSLYGNLQITNVSNTGSTLNGGQVSIYCTDGSLYKNVTTQDVVSISMPIGNYYLVQTVAVKGYNINAAKQSFTISPNKLTEVKVVNTPYGSDNTSTDAGKGNGTIAVITKKDGILTNAYDVILTGNGISLRGTPVNGEVRFTGLSEGTYAVSLANVPSGYASASDIVVLRENAMTASTILNTTKSANDGNGTLGIIVVDEFNYVIANKTFMVYASDTEKYLGTMTTDSKGYATLKGITSGTYKLIPTSVGSDYKSSTVYLTVKDSNGIVAKIVLLRSNNDVTTSRILPEFSADVCLDNYNTGVTKFTQYNDYKGSDKSQQTIDGETYNIVEDDVDFTGRARIIVKKPNNKVMSDVSISIYNAKDKKLFTGETNEDGELLLSGLEPKKEYHMTLKSSTLGGFYAPEDSKLIFSTKADKTEKVVITLEDEEQEQKTDNDAAKDKTVVSITTQNTNGTKINAEYAVYNSASEVVATAKTVNGIATFETDEVGSFTIKQTSVQSGYVLESEPYALTVSADGGNVSLTVTNENSGGKTTGDTPNGSSTGTTGGKTTGTTTNTITLPKTGEAGNHSVKYLGISVLCLAGIILLNRKQFFA